MDVFTKMTQFNIESFTLILSFCRISLHNLWELCALSTVSLPERDLKALNTLQTGLIMIGVIIGSRKVGINPDNVATPIAASLGDLITLALLSGISTGLYQELGE